MKFTGKMFTCFVLFGCLPLRGATDKEYLDAQKRFDAALKTATDALAGAAVDRTVTALRQFNTGNIALCDLTGYWHEDRNSSAKKSRAEKTLGTKQVDADLAARRKQLDDLLNRIAGLDLNRLNELARSITDHANAISIAALNAEGIIGPMTVAPTPAEKAQLNTDTASIGTHRDEMMKNLHELTNV